MLKDVGFFITRGHFSWGLCNYMLVVGYRSSHHLILTDLSSKPSQQCIADQPVHATSTCPRNIAKMSSTKWDWTTRGGKIFYWDPSTSPSPSFPWWQPSNLDCGKSWIMSSCWAAPAPSELLTISFGKKQRCKLPVGWFWPTGHHLDPTTLQN